MDKLLSVIVPIYNREKFLKRCIESILKQTYVNIELILVNDGSSDGSGKICDKYAASDLRVRVFHTNNKGSLSARSFGVSKARSEIITFVDSDDWIEEDMYFQMMNVFHLFEPDIISTGLNLGEELSTINEYDYFAEGLYDREKIVQDIVPFMMYHPHTKKRAITPSLCTKIMKKSLWEDVAKDINNHITYGEDAAITYICIAKARTVFFIQNAWYHYCVHNSSMIKSFNLDSFYKIKQFSDYMELKFKELGIWEKTWYQLKEYMKLFIVPAIEGVYGVELMPPQYQLPPELICKGCKVVIYGGGRVGKSYYTTCYNECDVNIVCWVDKNYEKLSESAYYIESPTRIRELDFDYVIVAIEDIKIVQFVKEELLKEGVSEEKIKWCKPIKIN